MLIGIEKPTMIVLLQLPTNASTISATSAAAMTRLAHDAAHCGAHELRLIEGQIELDAFGRDGAQRRQQLLGRVDDGEGGGVRLLEDDEVRRAPPVDPDHVLLRGVSVVDARDVAETDGRRR